MIGGLLGKDIDYIWDWVYSGIICGSKDGPIHELLDFLLFEQFLQEYIFDKVLRVFEQMKTPFIHLF